MPIVCPSYEAPFSTLSIFHSTAFFSPNLFGYRQDELKLLEIQKRQQEEEEEQRQKMVRMLTWADLSSNAG